MNLKKIVHGETVYAQFLLWLAHVLEVIGATHQLYSQ